MLNIHVGRQPDIRFQDGSLKHAVGVHSFEILRANRRHPERSDGFGWTYNHAPMLAWYHGKYYVEYISNPVSEHEPPGQTLLCASEDGIHWSFPQVVFPPIEVPLTCYRGPRSENMPETVQTVPHQRMGFYCGSNDCMLMLSFYGIVHDRYKSAPCDGWGVGRAVRRIYPDGSLGEICFLMYNEEAGYSRQTATAFASYEDSADEELIVACRELLEDRAVLNQMYEEQRNDHTLFPKALGKAASFYTVQAGEIVTVFKQGLSMRSEDGGKNWSEIVANNTLKTSTGKVWGQRTADGGFALMYNPTPDGQHRWPIAVVSGKDGYTFSDMRALTGFMSPQRYGGLDKNLGPQYMRGICERNPQPEDGRIHLTYSNNKEDIWISHFPSQLHLEAEKEINECFTEEALPVKWNIYSPAWAPVRMSGEALLLIDEDPCDRAYAERCVHPCSSGTFDLQMSVDTVSEQGEVCIELYDAIGGVPMQILAEGAHRLSVRSGGRIGQWTELPEGIFELKICFDCSKNSFTLRCGEKQTSFTMNTACEKICRIGIATKAPGRLRYCTIDSNGKYGSTKDDMPDTEEKCPATRAALYSFRFKGNEKKGERLNGDRK